MGLLALLVLNCIGINSTLKKIQQFPVFKQGCKADKLNMDKFLEWKFLFKKQIKLSFNLLKIPRMFPHPTHSPEPQKIPLKGVFLHFIWSGSAGVHHSGYSGEFEPWPNVVTRSM